MVAQSDFQCSKYQVAEHIINYIMTKVQVWVVEAGYELELVLFPKRMCRLYQSFCATCYSEVYTKMVDYFLWMNMQWTHSTLWIWGLKFQSHELFISLKILSSHLRIHSVINNVRWLKKVLQQMPPYIWLKGNNEFVDIK